MGTGTPIPGCLRRIRNDGSAPVENGRELIRDGEFKGHTVLDSLNPEGERVHVDPLPAERTRLVPAHSSVEPALERVADGRLVDVDLDARVTAPQDLCQP